MKRTFIYARFERFWHWMQAALILALAITGFEVHGTFKLIGFERAVVWHDRLAWALAVLIVFAIFWHFTTGAWKQYIPTSQQLGAMLKFYMGGIFRGEPHPVNKTELSKLNPLQRLTYLALKLALIPLQVITGFLYLYYNQVGIPIDRLALIHTAGAYAFLVFLIIHLYMTTTGHTVFSNLKAMITGWEELETENHPKAK